MARCVSGARVHMMGPHLDRCATCPHCGHIVRVRGSEPIRAAANPDRVPAESIIVCDRATVPAWHWSLLIGPDAGRLDIVLGTDDRAAQRVGVTIDGVPAMNGQHDVLRWPDGRVEIVERDEAAHNAS